MSDSVGDDVAALRTALRTAQHPRQRYHIREALQFAVIAASDTCHPEGTSAEAAPSVSARSE